MVQDQLVFLDGEYRFDQPRNMMAPSLRLSKCPVHFRIESGPADSQVILEHIHQGSRYECRLCFDNQREAEDWVKERSHTI